MQNKMQCLPDCFVNMKFTVYLYGEHGSQLLTKFGTNKNCIRTLLGYLMQFFYLTAFSNRMRRHTADRNFQFSAFSFQLNKFRYDKYILAIAKLLPTVIVNYTARLP